jgi:predicted Fe-Mo cluster-binding NifX family protein
MRLAITEYDGRVSPVYEVAKEILLIVVEGGREVSRERLSLNDGAPLRRVRRLLEIGVQTLICGGITASEVELLHAVGITVVDQQAGPVERVLREFIDAAAQGEPALQPVHGAGRDTHERVRTDERRPGADSQLPADGLPGRP